MLQIISRFYLPESPYQDFQLVGDKSLSEIVAKTKTLSITTRLSHLTPLEERAG